MRASRNPNGASRSAFRAWATQGAAPRALLRPLGVCALLACAAPTAQAPPPATTMGTASATGAGTAAATAPGTTPASLPGAASATGAGTAAATAPGTTPASLPGAASAAAPGTASATASGTASPAGAPPTPAAPTDRPPAELTFPDEAFRAKQPAPGPARAFKTPTIERFKLKSGIEVFLVERHELPLVALNLTFEGGSLLDPKGKEGMASLCAQLLTDGTQKLDKLALEEALADIASEVSSGATSDQHFVGLSALRPHLDTTLDLWADSMLRPGLRTDEFDRNRRRRIAGLQQMKANPQAIGGRLAGAVVYGREHLLGRFATEASYSNVGIDDCKAFAATWLRPQGAHLFAVGDLTRAEILAKIEPRLAALKGKPGRVPEPGRPQAPKGRIFFVDVPGAAQSVVTLTHLGPPRGAPDYFATNIMSGIVGGGFTSRINMNIREKHGYAYGAGGGFSYGRKQSTYRVSSSVRTDVTRESIVEVLKELNAFRDGEPTDDELSREKASRVLALPARFATGGDVLGAFRELVYFGLPLTYYDGYVKGYEGVTKASAKAAAGKHIRPADLRLLVVGDGKTVLPKLHELASGKELPGEIVKLDADGAIAK